MDLEAAGSAFLVTLENALQICKEVQELTMSTSELMDGKEDIFMGPFF